MSQTPSQNKTGQSRRAKRNAAKKLKKKINVLPVQQPQKAKSENPSQRRLKKEKANKIPGAMVPKVEEEPSQNFNIPISTLPVLANFALAVQGGMQQAIANGFEEYAEQMGVPGGAFYAYVYLTQVLFSYTSNSVPQVISVPLWLDVLGCALLPHTVPLGQGKVSYSFLTDTNYPGTLPYKTQALTGFYWMAQGDPAGTDVNGFIAMAQPVAYTEVLGQSAYQLLCRYVSNVTEWPGWVQVLPGKSWTRMDPSAYAASWIQLGSGSSTISSVLSEVMLETPLLSPVLSKFADWYASTPRRYFRHTRSVGGDANYLGFLLSIETLRRRIQSKIIPKFKQIDFFEFMDVLGWWLSGAMLNAAQNTNISATIPLCPLTWQQLAICVRQAIGFCWMPHVLSGQFMESESQNVNVNFQPFTWGTNCYPSNIAASMKFPRIFIESIRSLQGYMVDLKFLDRMTKKEIVGGMAYASPVLGTYQGDDPVQQYYFDTGAEFAFPVFTVDGGEIPIDLVDFTYFSGGAVPLDANGAELLLLVEAWNSWLTTTIDSNISGLEAIGSDFPPKQLHSLHMTNFCAFTPSTVAKPRKKIGYACVTKSKLSREKKYKRSSSMEKGKEIEVKTEVRASYDEWGVTTVISQNTILKAVYDNWQGTIVLPTVRTVQDPGDYLTPFDYTSLGTAYNEPYSIITSQAAEENLAPYESLTNRHKRFASTMYRTALSSPTTMEIFLDEMVKTGRGGSLGSLFGSLAGSLLEKYIPGATQIGGMLGNAVGDMVPI